MEAQGLLSGFCSKSTIPSIQITHKHLSLTLYHSSSYSFGQAHEYVFFKTCHSMSSLQAKGPFKILSCVNSTAEVVGAVFDKEDYKKLEIKKKKLAIFVSGGGSNFKSIHEACVKGSIYGDIVVLVTNKQGMFCCYFSLSIHVLQLYIISVNYLFLC